MAAPPSLTPPQKALKRVRAIARIDSGGIVTIASLSLLVTLVQLEPMGLVVSGLALYAGLTEMRGGRALGRSEAVTGMKLLVRAQTILLGVILVYCARCLFSFDIGYVRDDLLPEVNQLMPTLLGLSLDEFLKESGLTVDDLVVAVRRVFLLAYGGVALLSVLYQGGLILYFRRRTPLVVEALQAPPPVGGHSPLA